jgi:hypothetical protein
MLLRSWKYLLSFLRLTLMLFTLVGGTFLTFRSALDQDALATASSADTGRPI